MKKCFIKKYLLILSIVSVLSNFTIKSVESNNIINNHINQISEENIQKFKRSFIIKEKFNNKIFWGTAGLSTVGIGGAFVYWMVQKPAKSKSLDDCFNNFSILPPETKNILKQLAQLGLQNAKNINSVINKREEGSLDPSWTGYAKNASLTIASNAKNLAWALASYVAWQKTKQFINPYLPNTAKRGDKICSSRTLSWFIDHNTSLNQTIKDIVNFLKAQNTNTNTSTDTEKYELASIINLFVNNIEKILGFMDYNLEQIASRSDTDFDNSSKLIVYSRVSMIMHKIKQLTGNLIDLAESNQAKKFNFNNDKLYINILKELVNNFKSFCTVQKIDLGYQNSVPRHTFAKLRFILEPQQPTQKDSKKDVKELQDLKTLKSLLAKNSI